MAIRVGYLLRGLRVLRRAPHHCGGTNVTITQKPEREPQIWQGTAGLGASVIRRRASFTWRSGTVHSGASCVGCPPGCGRT
jgi:hypothetical protein